MHSQVLAIDPGTTESGYVYFYEEQPEAFDKVPNDDILAILLRETFDLVLIEKIASYGMPVGASVFDTCFWSGRFMQAARAEVRLIKRIEVKKHLCGTHKANDAIIRQRLIEIYGGPEKAIGTRRNPGPLFGMRKDMWAALAVGLTGLGIGGAS